MLPNVYALWCNDWLLLLHVWLSMSACLSIQLVTSAHYLLSDLYITDDVDDFETSSDQSTEDSDDQIEQVSKFF